MKQTGIYLILGGAVVFILVFIGKIMALVFNNPLLGLALMAVVIGVFIYCTVSSRKKEWQKKTNHFVGLINEDSNN